jgi:2-oxo-4-hydroxy-4-carboxy--5-ureidoimidazoline (OHCU) decarboxylase
MRYTPKQIEKYQRQKYITLLEKVTKNLFRMFRDEKTTQEQFLKKFEELKGKLSEQDEILLNSEYHQQMRAYIDRLSQEVQSEFVLDDIRDVNMTLLNRLQKLKNRTSYKRDKHKKSSQNEDWG